MSLQVWLPLQGDIRNQGLGNYTISTMGTISWVSGKLGANAMKAGDGTQIVNGLRIEDSFTTLLNGDYSVSVWVKPYGTHVHYNGSIFSSGNWNTANKRWAFGVSQDNTKVDVLCNEYNTYLNCPVPVNEWTHLVCTCGADRKIKLYKNGEYIGTVDRGTNAFDSDYSWSAIGRESYASGYFSFNGAIQDFRLYDHCLSPMEVKRISQGLVLHYPLNRMGFGQENFILESHKVISGGQANGITRTYENDGSMKIVASSGNGTWCSLGFAKNSNTNVGNNMTVGDTYCISCDVKVESGTALPTLFINNGNSYKQLKPVNGSIITDKWMRIYYSSTWADPGTSSYGNISLHLGFNNAIGTYYFKNFKLEKGSIPTPWSPAPSDDLATQMGLNSNIEYDTSGYCNNGTITGTPIYTSDTPKYIVSTQFTGTQYILSESPTTNGATLAAWVKTTSTSNQALVIDYKSGLGIGFWSSYIIPSCNSAIKTTYPNSAYHVNEWNHIVVVKNSSSSILCYVNGELQNAGSAQDYWSTNVIDGFSIAARPNGASPSTCQISDVRIYATALSADDVKSLYQNTATIDADGTIHGAVR